MRKGIKSGKSKKKCDAKHEVVLNNVMQKFFENQDVKWIGHHQVVRDIQTGIPHEVDKLFESFWKKIERQAQKPEQKSYERANH